MAKQKTKSSGKRASLNWFVKMLTGLSVVGGLALAVWSSFFAFDVDVTSNSGSGNFLCSGAFAITDVTPQLQSCNVSTGNGDLNLSLTFQSSINSTDPLCTYQDGIDLAFEVGVDNSNFLPLVQDMELVIPAGEHTVDLKVIPSPLRCPSVGSLNLSSVVNGA